MALGRDEAGLCGPPSSAMDQIKFPPYQRSRVASGIPALKPTDSQIFFFSFLFWGVGAIRFSHIKNFKCQVMSKDGKFNCLIRSHCYLLS